MTKLDFNAPEISCDHCKAAVEKDLAGLPGVGEVVVDVAAKAVQVNYDDSVLGEERLRSTLTEIGYPPSA